jgi:hypothetical protein
VVEAFVQRFGYSDSVLFAGRSTRKHVRDLIFETLRRGFERAKRPARSYSFAIVDYICRRNASRLRDEHVISFRRLSPASRRQESPMLLGHLDVVAGPPREERDCAL